MARLTPDRNWAFVDDAMGRNLRPPRATHVQNVIRALNHVAGRNPRVLFCQHFSSPPTAADPMLRFRFNQNFVNGRRLIHSVLFFPPFAATPGAGAAVPRVQSEDAAGTEDARRSTMIVGGSTEPADIRETWWHSSALTPIANAYLARRVGGFNGYLINAIAVQETSDLFGGALDSTWGGAIDPLERPSAGLVVSTTLIDELQKLEDALWTTQRPVVAAWSAGGFGAGDARSVVGTTTKTNLIDLTSTSRTSTTPGEICPAQYASRGTETYLTARAYVYAQMVDGGGGGTGTVEFRSSLNTVAAAGITTTAGWFATSATLQIASGSTEYDKVDILGAPANALDTLRVWAWGIQIEPT